MITDLYQFLFSYCEVILHWVQWKCIEEIAEVV